MHVSNIQRVPYAVAVCGGTGGPIRSRLQCPPMLIRARPITPRLTGFLAAVASFSPSLPCLTCDADQIARMTALLVAAASPLTG